MTTPGPEEPPDPIAERPPERDTRPRGVPEGEGTRVAVIGDSMGIDLATGLRIWGEERGEVLVLDLSISGCPLSRDGERRLAGREFGPVPHECGWWSRAWSARSRDLDAFDPEVVVVQAGYNELMDRRLPRWARYRSPGDPVRDGWLVDEYRALIRRLRGEGARVLVANTACADFRRYRYWKLARSWERVESDNERVYPSLRFTGVRVADFFGELCPDGTFTQHVAGVDGARPDGFHLTDEAAAALARDWLGPMVLDMAEPPEVDAETDPDPDEPDPDPDDVLAD